MGSHKKHKKDAKKKKNRDRSRSGSEEAVTKEKRRHKKHHKERKREKRPRDKSEDSYESEDDDVILVPPPPKISRPESPPPPPVISVSPPRTAPSAPSPPRISSSSDQSLSIEETNRLRAKLGLKPLQVSGPAPVPKSEEKPAKILEGGTDMGEFVHRPADNLAEKLKTEKLKAKLTERKERRAMEAKLAKVKRLADDSDDESAAAWVSKNRKITEERLKAEKRAKVLDDMDAIFGVGELVEEEIRNSRKDSYSTKDLRGLRVEHNMDGFAEGKEVILTLKDKGVLDEDEDALINVNLIDDERYKKNIDRKKQKPQQFGYDVYNEEEEEEKSVLSKYDEEIDGEKKTSFVLGVDEATRKEQVKSNLIQKKKMESLSLPSLQLASDYYTEQEMIKFKKPKKKVRKIRERKKILKADQLLPENANSNGNTEDWLKDIGSRRTPNVNLKPDPDGFDVESYNSYQRPSHNVQVKDEPIEDPMDVDDLPAPAEDLSEVKVEPEDDSELEMALRKARKLKQKEAVENIVNPEKVAKMILSEETGYGETGPGGSIVLNSTAEFCRTLGDIPTYGLAGNRDEDAQELLDFEREMKREKLREDSSIKRSGWNDVEMDERLVDIAQYEAPILEAEPHLGMGMAGALRLAVSKGYLEKEESNRPSASRFAHLQAQNYSIEDKAHAEDDKFGRRERYCGPTSDFKEKDGYKPNVKLEYIDDNGHLLCAKEAFRYLSHKFHGKGPGKNKVEKRMKKGEQELLMKQMSSTDTPLGTLNMLQAKQKETQSAYVVLSGSKQLQQASSISKTKM